MNEIKECKHKSPIYVVKRIRLLTYCLAYFCYAIAHFFNIIRSIFCMAFYFKNVIETVFNAIKNFIQTIWNAIKEHIIQPVTNAVETVKQKFEDMKQRISDKVTSIRQNISNKFQEIKDRITKPINLHATTYLIIGTNSRFEDYGSNRTGCFWIGS